MNIETLHIGMKVRHPQYGVGVVKSLTGQTAEIAFDDAQRTIAPESSDLQPAESTATLSELEMPLAKLISDTAHAVVEALGLEKQDTLVESLATRWQSGTLIMQPADSSLQSKEVPLETFFHKIVMIRNNLRVLEQKVNASDKLSEADKFDLQQYITRCYGSLTTFNILFKTRTTNSEPAPRPARRAGPMAELARVERTEMRGRDEIDGQPEGRECGMQSSQSTCPADLTLYVIHVYRVRMVFGTLAHHVQHQKFAVGAFPRRLRAWRERNNLSQSEAALKLQISKRTLQEWEQDRAAPRGLARTAIEKAIRA